MKFRLCSFNIENLFAIQGSGAGNLGSASGCPIDLNELPQLPGAAGLAPTCMAAHFIDYIG